MELIHTCYRVTDPERSLVFDEALGFEKRRELPIRDEAVNYFLGVRGREQPELELTYNFGVDDEHGIEPERPPYQVREGGSFICFVRDPDR
jgi:lactoylglutathione lyase